MRKSLALIFVTFLLFLPACFATCKIILYPEELKASFETPISPIFLLYNNLSKQSINKILKEHNIPCTVINLKINKTSRLITLEIKCSTFKIIENTVDFNFVLYPNYDPKFFKNKTIVVEIVSASPYYGISKIKYHKCKKEIYEGIEYWSCDMLTKTFNLSRNIKFSLNFGNGSTLYEIREIILKKIPVNKTVKVISGSELKAVTSSGFPWKDLLKIIVIIFIAGIIYFVIIRPRRRRL